MNARILGFTFAIGLLACQDSATAPHAVDPPNQPAPPTASLSIALAYPVMVRGSVQTLTVLKDAGNGARIQVLTASWSSSKPSVISVNGLGVVEAISVGEATITATVDGLSASRSITVIYPFVSGTSNALIVDDFSMAEIQYPDAAHWQYAPQVRVRAATGRALTILKVAFSIPGLDPIPSWDCVAGIGTQPTDLNGEVYGDWALTIGGSGRAAAQQVSATILFGDDAGVVDSMRVSGFIVPGTMPTTYSGGNNGGACFRGYRPPG